MARYIDADMITYQDYIRVDGCCIAETEPYVTKSWIDRMPEEDVAPIVHGKWTDTSSTNHKRCSNCDVISFIALYPCINKADYCPHCGAKMEE